MYTEPKAKDRWCPMVRSPQGKYDWTNREGFTNGTHCIASECMMWRWLRTLVGTVPEGYCGLAGKQQ